MPAFLLLAATGIQITQGERMKFGRFDQQGRVFFGIVESDTVHELDGSPFDTYRKTGRRHALAALKVLVPCTPANFYCAGLNYLAHIEWANQRKGTNRKPPEKADIGLRLMMQVRNKIIDAYQDIMKMQV